jgi:hypothetical protein
MNARQERIEAFMAQMKGIPAGAIIEVFNDLCAGTNFRGCSKNYLAETWAEAVGDPNAPNILRSRHKQLGMPLNELRAKISEVVKKSPRFQKTQGPKFGPLNPDAPKGNLTFEALAEGTYRLTTALVNRSFDGRVSHDWRHTSRSFEAGTLVEVEDVYADIDGLPERVLVRKLIGLKKRQYRFQTLPLHRIYRDEDLKGDKSALMALDMLPYLEHVGPIEKTETTKEKIARLTGEVQILRDFVEMVAAGNTEMDRLEEDARELLNRVKKPKSEKDDE